MFLEIKKFASLGSCSFLLIMAPMLAWSHGSTYEKLLIDHPYAVLSQDPLGASIYFRELTNRGQQTYRLTGAQTEVANDVRLQAETHTPDHVIQWVTIESITIKPKASIRFRHNHEQGYRVWLTDLRQQLKDGDTFDLKLTFDDGGQKTVNVWIQTPRIGKKTHTH